MISTGYAIASKAAIKALTSSQRTDSYARLVREIPAWYIFLADSTETADDDAVLMPNDTPATGRWIKSSGVGGGGTAPYEIKTGNYTLVNQDKIIVLPDYTVASDKNITITLPANPQPGWEVEMFAPFPYGDSGIFDYNNYRINIFINENGSKFMSENWSQVVFGYPDIGFSFYSGGKLIYINSAIGWFILGSTAIYNNGEKTFRYYFN